MNYLYLHKVMESKWKGIKFLASRIGKRGSHPSAGDGLGLGGGRLPYCEACETPQYGQDLTLPIGHDILVSRCRTPHRIKTFKE
jgi:hypothetical protein